MQFEEIASFEVSHHKLAWPWVAVSPTRRAFAWVADDERVATRLWDDATLVEGPSFALPADLRLPRSAAPPTGHGGVERGIHAIAVDGDASHVAVTGRVAGVSVLVTLHGGSERRSRVDALMGGEFIAHALTFDHTGQRLWLSAESGAETAIALLDARTHAVLGVVRSAPFPPPAFHELFVHPADDGVLLLAACGQDGTFARVARAEGGTSIALRTALDDGADPAGLVGFSTDGTRVHLVSDAELRTHSWPDLVELSSVALDDDFASSYGGVVIGDSILLDGHDADTGDEDRLMRFDASALRGATLAIPAPPGMWVGRVGSDLIITVASKGEPARGRVVRVTS
jgi:hypothetical protein